MYVYIYRCMYVYIYMPYSHIPERSLDFIEIQIDHGSVNIECSNVRVVCAPNNAEEIFCTPHVQQRTPVVVQAVRK